MNQVRTRTSRIVISIVTAVTIALVVSTVLNSDVWSREGNSVYCVSPEAPEEASGDCWDDPTDLHTALRSAQPGDEIWIRQGRYTPGESPSASFYLPEGVTVYGGFTGSLDDPSERDEDPILTVLDGQDLSYSVVTAAGAMNVTLDGLTIVNGAATVIAEEAIDPQRRGGGIYISNSTVTLRNLMIANNRARFGGGGVYVDEGSVVDLQGITFQGNETTHSHSGRGGGMRILAGEARMTDVIFRSNHAVRGGGLFVDDADVTIARALFSENTSTNQGGGIALHRGELAIQDSRFVFNESETEGGALSISSGATSVTLGHVEIIGNRARSSGGGLEIRGGTVSIFDSEISDNMAGNEGGGALSVLEAVLDVQSSLIQGNYALRGGGILVRDSDATIINAVISENAASTEPRPITDADTPSEGMPYDPLRRSITGEVISSTPPEEDPEIGAIGGGLLILGHGKIEVINATITGNRSDQYGPALFRSGDNATALLNSIVFGNLTTGADLKNAADGRAEIWSTLEADSTIRISIGHSVVWGGCVNQVDVDCWHVIAHDPLFRDAPDPLAAPTRAGDVELWFTSPAIDAADPRYLPEHIEEDATGNDRFVTKRNEPAIPWTGSNLDIGAIETPRRDAAASREIVVDQTHGRDSLSVNVRSDANGAVSGTVNVDTGEWRFEDALLGQIRWDGQRAFLDGQAVLDSGRVAGFEIEFRISGSGSEFHQYRVRLDTGMTTGWRSISSH